MDYDALERLARLRDSGILTKEEFAAEKQRLLSGQHNPPDSRPAESEGWAGMPRLLLGALAILVFVVLASRFGGGDVSNTVAFDEPMEPTNEAAEVEDVAALGDLRGSWSVPEDQEGLAASWTQGNLGDGDMVVGCDREPGRKELNFVFVALDGHAGMRSVRVKVGSSFLDRATTFEEPAVSFQAKLSDAIVQQMATSNAPLEFKWEDGGVMEVPSSNELKRVIENCGS